MLRSEVPSLPGPRGLPRDTVSNELPESEACVGLCGRTSLPSNEFAWQTRAVFMCKPETHSNHESGVRQGLSCILQSSVQEISSDKHRLLVGRPWKLPPGHGGRRGAGATSGKHETPGRSPRTDRNVPKRCSLAKLHQMHRGLWQAPPGAQSPWSRACHF